MDKVFAAAVIILALGSGAAFAQTTTITQPAQIAVPRAGLPAGSYRLASLRSQHAFGVGTTSALSRNVGPASTVNAYSHSPIDSPNSGMPLVPGAPSTSNAAGGN